MWDELIKGWRTAAIFIFLSTALLVLHLLSHFETPSSEYLKIGNRSRNDQFLFTIPELFYSLLFNLFL